MVDVWQLAYLYVDSGLPALRSVILEMHVMAW